MYDSNPTGSIPKIIRGHLAGHYELPDDVLAAHRLAEAAAAEVEAARRRPRADLAATARKTLVRDVLDALANGTGLPDGSSVTEAEQAERHPAALAMALRQAAAISREAFADLVADQAEAIIVDCLRPAFVETLEAAREAVAALKGIPLIPDAIIDAPKSVQTAYRSLTGIGERYAAVREARRLLVSFEPPQLDERDLFGQYRNAHQLWPSWNQPRSVPPWPTTDMRALLVWMSTASGPPPELWLPTGREQDERFGEVFAEGLAGMANQRAAKAAVDAWGAARS